MKKITTFLGCVGVVCLFWGCSSSEDILDPNAAFADEDIVSSESGDTPTSSSSSASKPSSSDAKQNPQKDPGSGTTDSVIVEHDTVTKQVVIIQNADLGDIPTPNYRKDEVFCWSDECKTKYAGQTTNPDLPSSSSMTIDIGMSVEPPVIPEVSENQMVDKRDNQSYKLTRIGGLHWMAENLKYVSKKGSYCEFDGKDHCGENGVYYSYAAAQTACPTGWRLPTKDEVENAATNQPDSWWTIGGRFKLNDEGEDTECGLDDGQGYIWIIPSDNVSSWRIKAYSGKKKKKAFHATEGARAYNVRCVEGE